MTASENSPRKPRVLHFVTHLALGGAERVALDVIRGLRDDFDSAAYAVLGVAADDVGRSMATELAASGVPLFTGTRVPMKMGGMFFAGRGAAQAVSRFNPDLIHLHTEIPEATYATMVTLHPRLARIPLVRTIHNSIYWHHWPRLGRWCERRMPRPWIAAVSRDALLAFERHRATARCAENPLGSTVIYNGVSEPPHTGDGRLGSGGALRVLFAGRFDEQKGADLLPEILRTCQLPEDIRGELTVYGDGKHRAGLRALATRPPRGWTVEVNAPVANLSEKIREYDLVIVPSRFEGLGLIVIEAMLAGVPVVGTDAPGLREALPPNHPWVAVAGSATGFAQTLHRTVAARAAWPEITVKARDFARRHFAPAAMIAAYGALYRNALVPVVKIRPP